MTWNNRVVWSEGMFLRPQHFQQQDRYLESLIQDRSRYLRTYDWGIKSLTLDQEALVLGKVAIAAARGILPDGTPFNIPNDDDPPTPLELDEEVRDVRVLLALPLKRTGMVEVDRDNNPDALGRYRATVAEARDNIAGTDGVAPLEVGKRRFRLLLDHEDQREYACTGLVRVREKRPDQTLVLDTQYLPPCLDCRGVPGLKGFIAEILGLLHQRGQALAERGSLEMAQFLRLMVVNRAEPLFVHLDTMSGLHPEDFYRIALQLAGELSTFAKSKRPVTLPAYQHDDLQTTFTPLMIELRQVLSLEEQERAIQLPLQARAHGIHVSPISDRSLLSSALFVLAVRANMPSDTLRTRFPNQLKIGPVERIARFVNSHLPGIGVNALATAPRQLPYHEDFIYFQLDRNSEYWQQMTQSGGFALHVAGQIPGMEMTFWAIRINKPS